jgi:hypothetical protein
MTLVLRTRIDGIWSLAEFSDFTSEMQFLYDLVCFLSRAMRTTCF